MKREKLFVVGSGWSRGEEVGIVSGSGWEGFRRATGGWRVHKGQSSALPSPPPPPAAFLVSGS